MGVIKSIRTQEYELAKVQDNIINAVNRLFYDAAIINGNFVTAKLTTSDTAVSHGLRRALKGWIVVRKQGAGDVYESATTNPRPNDQLIFNAGAPVTVTLYFF
jgi:hypothetical protein